MMGYMEQKADEQIEAGIHRRDAIDEAIAESERATIEKALGWRKEWIDQEDLDEMESGCDCEICELIRAADSHLALLEEFGPARHKA